MSMKEELKKELEAKQAANQAAETEAKELADAYNAVHAQISKDILSWTEDLPGVKATNHPERHVSRGNGPLNNVRQINVTITYENRSLMVTGASHSRIEFSDGKTKLADLIVYPEKAPELNVLPRPRSKPRGVVRPSNFGLPPRPHPVERKPWSQDEFIKLLRGWTLG